MRSGRYGTGTLMILAALRSITMQLVPPTERTCERCGRHDVWDDSLDSWTITTEDGEKTAGNPYCLHEWDINGDYSPLEE